LVFYLIYHIKLIFYHYTSALDPAAPYFEDEHIDRRLDPTDADFVDVTHTGARTIYINGFGTTQNMGHIDFYPNGGSSQVGCANFDLSRLSFLLVSSIIWLLVFRGLNVLNAILSGRSTLEISIY